MIPLLIIWLVKNLSRRNKISKAKTLQLILVIALSPVSIHAQEKLLRYNILHDGEIKGTMVVRHQVQGQQVHLKVESEVKTRFLIRVTVKSMEEAIFENGILVYSSLCRTVNGDEKINQQIQANGITYKIINKNKTTELPGYPINHSILWLYYEEPVNVSKIYSDNFQQYVEIKKTEPNKYKIVFPNGNINYYSYKEGVCTSVEVNQFYDIQFQLIR